MRKVVNGAVVSSALVAAALIAPAAQAAPCDGIGAEQPFLDWNDTASYVLVDGGDFESAAAGWQLDGGAATAAGGNPLRPQSSATALSMPDGSSAVSPPVCVAGGDPLARVFTQAPGAGKEKARLKVEVLYLNADGDVRKVKKAGKLNPQTSWGPSRRFSIAQGHFARKVGTGQSGQPHGQSGQPHGNSGGDGDGQGNSGGENKPAEGGHGGGAVKSTHIALRFTSTGAGVLVDDVFVDPRMRR